MKKLLSIALCALLLTGCTAPAVETTVPTTEPMVTEPAKVTGPVVEITLKGQDIAVSGDGTGVFISRDIVYYENKIQYDSGLPYGEGEEWQMHSREEAAEHLVVNITAPGTYRLSGELSKGQIRIDLGEDADSDPNAVVNLILDGVEITCTVAPAIVFRNVYECDGNWSEKTAGPDVDTTAAGANLILAENSHNIVNGSHVAKIYKDKEGEKKLWKQDGAVYSYMSLNIYGPGALEINADNEGLDTELHLSIFGGDITIRSANDGINTNEDGVSVTAIRGGNLRILAGLGEEGDGIDSNGYLVVYGGTLVSAAHPASDGGLDSDLGTFIHGGTVIALGSAMNQIDPKSGQVTMCLQFMEPVTGALRITREDGSEVFAYDPLEDTRSYRGVVISCPEFRAGEGYQVFAGELPVGHWGDDWSMAPGMGGPGGPGLPGEVPPPEDMPGPPEGDFTLPPEPSEDMDAMLQGTPPTGPQDGQPEGTFTTEVEMQTVFLLKENVNSFFCMVLTE